MARLSREDHVMIGVPLLASPENGGITERRGGFTNSEWRRILSLLLLNYENFHALRVAMGDVFQRHVGALARQSHLAMALLAGLTLTTGDSNADDCVSAPPADYIAPQCPSETHTLHDQANRAELESKIQESAQGVRAEFGIPAPPDHWRTDYRRQDLTNIRDGRPALVPLLIARGLADSERVASTVHRQLRAMRGAYPNFDPSLTMAKAFWEGGGHWLQAGQASVNTFGTGGMDNFGAEDHFPRYRSQAPCGFARQWQGHEDGIPSRTNKAGDPVYPAEIPANELLVAYGLRLLAARQRAIEVLNAEFPSITYETLSLPTRRFLALVAFAGPYGYDYDRTAHGDDPPARGLGIDTLLQWSKARSEAGLLRSLDDLPFDVAIRRYHRLRGPLVVTAIARMLDQNLLETDREECEEDTATCKLAETFRPSYMPELGPSDPCVDECRYQCLNSIPTMCSLKAATLEQCHRYFPEGTQLVTLEGDAIRGRLRREQGVPTQSLCKTLFEQRVRHGVEPHRRWDILLAHCKGKCKRQCRDSDLYLFPSDDCRMNTSVDDYLNCDSRY